MTKIKILGASAAFALLLTPGRSQRLPEITSPFQGRWDMVVTAPDGSTSPRWMDFVEGRDPLIRVQPKGGSVHPVYDPDVDGTHLKFIVDKPTAKRPATVWELKIKNKVITGTQTAGDGVSQIKGVKAPELKREETPKVWGKAEPLFDGKDLNGWEAFPSTAKNNWVAQNDELVNTAHGANLMTTQKFNDFKLHIELNCPDDGNSGIYLRGRYEIQVAYEKEPDKFHSMGAIYGFLAPDFELPRKPGNWESFDVTLVGRMVTIIRDKTKIVDNREIPGITGGALDSNEGEPGPFYIQGDHTGGMKYRNITVQLPKE
jgi:hypothetical protein